jgi:ATP-dependent Clp protease protease subunit
MSDFNYYLMEDVEEGTAKEFAEFLSTIPQDSSVTIQILSHGGLVFAGLGICQMIKQAQARGIKFTANVFGIAASAASDITLACDKIYMAEGAQILIHSAWGGTGEGIDIANNEQLSLVHKRLPDYSEKDLAQDRWFGAEEAIKIGLADGYISKNNESRAVYKLAAFLTPCMEDKKMAEIKTKAAEEEVVERKIDEEEEKKEEIAPEAECGDGEKERADEEMDLMEAMVRRLEEIEHRLAVLEGEGKKADDEAAPNASARRKALLAKLNAVCAPSPRVEAKAAVVETPDEESARFKATYQNFDNILADFIKRK